MATLIPVDHDPFAAPQGPSTLDQAKKYAQFLNPAGYIGTQIGQAVAENPRTVWDQAYQGATFNLGDEIQDVAGSGVAYISDKMRGIDGGSYTDILDGARKSSQARLAKQLQDTPEIAIPAQIAGSLVTGGIGAGTKTGAAVTNSLRTGGLGLRAGKAALLGASAGGMAGIGAGSGVEDRLERGGESALVSAGIGAAIPIAGELVNKAIGKPIAKAADYASRKIAESSGEIPAVSGGKAIDKVAARLQADNPNDLARALNSYAATPDQALIQVGGARTANLAEGSAQYPSGGAKAVEYFDDAVSRAPDKLKGTIAKTVSPSANYYDTVDDIVKAGREKAAPLYSAAYQKNQVVDSPVINRILQTPEGKSALSEAVQNMQNQMALVSKPDKELTALANELEMVSTGRGVGKGLKLQTLDEIKKAMDQTINKAYRTGDEAQAKRIIQLKSGLVSELDAADKSGLYAKARRASGDYLSNREAAEAGVKFLSDDPQVIARNYASYGPTERKAYKVGVLKTLRNDLDNKVDGQNVARIFNKPATRQKLEAVLTPAEYNKLLGDAKATDNIYKLRNQITGNSRTAQRQIAADEFSQETGEFITSVATKGPTRAVIDKGIQAIAKQFDGLSDKTAREVAEILYETDPKKKYQIVKDLTNIAKSKGGALRATEASKKLRAFYTLSDAVAEAKSKVGALALPAGAVVTDRPQPTRIEVNPNQPNPYQALPEVSLPKMTPVDYDPFATETVISPMSNNATIPATNDLMGQIKQAESAGDPNAKNPNSSASGLYQFTDQTWRSAVDKWGRRNGIKYSDKANPQAQEAMMSALTQDNARILQNKGIEPTDQNIYFAHFMGAPAASKAIGMLGKNAVAARSFPDAARANPQVFFDGGRPRTVDEVYQLITSKVG